MADFARFNGPGLVSSSSLSDTTIRKARGGGGGGGYYQFLALYEKGGGGGGGAVDFWPDTESGGRYDRVSGSPGYSTVVESIRSAIQLCHCNKNYMGEIKTAMRSYA